MAIGRTRSCYTTGWNSKLSKLQNNFVISASAINSFWFDDKFNLIKFRNAISGYNGLKKIIISGLLTYLLT